MSERRRQQLDADTWCEVMRRFDTAGATVSEFCAREGLSESSFYRRRARMGSFGSVAAGPAQRTLAAPPAAASFIDLGSLGGARRDGGNSLELRLDLGGGVVLQIVRR